MISLFSAIFCSSMIAVIFKFSEKKQSNRVAITTFNYIVACTISFLLLPQKNIFATRLFYSFGNEAKEVFANGSMFSNEASGAWAIIIGSITGVIYFSSFWLYQYSVNKNGAALSATFMKLGVLVPTILSIFFFKEIPTVLQAIGIAMAVVGILIINLSQEKNIMQNIKLDLLFLFILGGLGDFNSKMYQSFGQIEYKELYIFCLFTTALIISTIILLAKNKKITKNDIIVGLLVGIPNQLTAYFLVKSLNSLKASIAFPIFSAGTILLVNIINIMLFKERLSKRQNLAIGVIMVSLIFLNI